MLKIAVLQEIEDMKKKLDGYLALFMYRLSNLCIKADPQSLLAIEVPTEIGIKKVEEVCEVGLLNDFEFQIVPFDQDFIPGLEFGIKKIHPEFKIKTMCLKDDEDFKYFIVTMPEVDEDRRDVLNEGVDTYYDITYPRIESTYEASKAKLELKIAALPDDKKEESKKAHKDLYDKVKSTFEEVKADKLKEIKEAYQLYLTKQKEKGINSDEKKDAMGQHLGKSLKLN